MRPDDDFAGADGAVDLTVVVVTYNSSADIEHLLGDLRREARNNVMRVVVVDNNSSDETRDIVAQHSDVISVSSGGNIGYAGGINVARRRVGDCRAVLILNPDLRVRPGAVGMMLSMLDDSRVGVVVPRIVDGDGLTYPSLRTEPSVLGALGDSLFGAHLARRSVRWTETVWNLKNYQYPHEIDWATGAALLIRADVDRAVGDWDERYFLYSEETDFFRRVRASGGLIWFEPRAVVAHRGAGSGSSPELAALMSVNRVRYFERYHGKLHSSCHRAVVTLGEMLRCRDSAYRTTVRVLCDRARWTDLPKAEPAPVSTNGVALGQSSCRDTANLPS